MDYRCEVVGDRFIVSISGVLTFDDHERFRQVIGEIAECAPAMVELSLASTKMVDSAGIGMLLLANDKAVRGGKTLRLSGVTGHVAKVIELSKIDQLIPVD
ncbi:STAS domain-containing protein [Maricaulis sp.]|uniref:STAS domain-containing protein n=1 Tax=Maricaulis sp. TaxID=1486257 RepID=UPI0025BE893C|nr:STAS domain-containing protein [Maricaulis sp.]